MHCRGSVRRTPLGRARARIRAKWPRRRIHRGPGPSLEPLIPKANLANAFVLGGLVAKGGGGRNEPANLAYVPPARKPKNSARASPGSDCVGTFQRSGEAKGGAPETAFGRGASAIGLASTRLAHNMAGDEPEGVRHKKGSLGRRRIFCCRTAGPAATTRCHGNAQPCEMALEPIQR